jgi:hypothetical protein
MAAARRRQGELLSMDTEELSNRERERMSGGGQEGVGESEALAWAL